MVRILAFQASYASSILVIRSIIDAWLSQKAVSMIRDVPIRQYI